MKALPTLTVILAIIVGGPCWAQSVDDSKASYNAWLDRRYRDLLRELSKTAAMIRNVAPLKHLPVIDAIRFEVARDQQLFEITSSMRGGQRYISVSHFAFDTIDVAMDCLALEMVYRGSLPASSPGSWAVFPAELDLRNLKAFGLFKRIAMAERENKIRRLSAPLPRDSWRRAYGDIGLASATPCDLKDEYKWLNEQHEAQVSYNRVRNRIRLGYLLFVVGHEIGHHVLGHFEAQQRSAVEMENEADSYAVATIFRVLSPSTAFGVLIPIAALHYFYAFLDIGAIGGDRAARTSHPSADCRMIGYLGNVSSLLADAPEWDSRWNDIRNVIGKIDVKELRRRFAC